MKKNYISLTAAVFLCAVMATAAYADPTTDGKIIYIAGNDTTQQSGITKDGTKSYYIDGSGNQYSGWMIINGSTYYFNNDTKAMSIGWLILDQNRYYFDQNGKMQTGLVDINNNKYCFDSQTGVMKTGWINTNGKWSFFDKSSGVMYKNRITPDGYYINETGLCEEYVPGKTGNMKLSENGINLRTYAEDVFNQLNEKRAQSGLKKLVWNDLLYEAAEIRADELSKSMTRQRLCGSDFSTAYTECGYKGWNTCAENITCGDDNKKMIVDFWIKSDNKRNNLMNKDMVNSAVGVVYSDGKYYWTQEFAN